MQLLPPELTQPIHRPIDGPLQKWSSLFRFMGAIRYRLNGKDVTEAEFRAHQGAGLDLSAPPGCAQHPSCWPMLSDGVGVHPTQRQAAYDESVRLGVPTQYDSTGRAVINDPGHHKRLLKALGMVDRGRKVNNMPRRRQL